MTIYADQVFAPLDRDFAFERIAGGNETEVYRTDDQRYVVKLKSDHGGLADVALAHALTDRAAAERFIACLGPEHTITSYYVVARDSFGRAQSLVIQPYLVGAQQLFDIDYRALSWDEACRLHHSCAKLFAARSASTTPRPVCPIYMAEKAPAQPSGRA